MNKLTKQLYEGTLPSGNYYFNNGKTNYLIHYVNVKGFPEPKGLIVLCKAPSYEEYIDLKEKLESAICELAGEDW